MENLKSYLNFGEFNRKPTHDLRTQRNLYNEENRVRQQNNGRTYKQDNPVVVTNKASLANVLKQDHIYDANHKPYFDIREDSFITKHNSKTSQNNSIINKNFEKRHAESHSKIDKFRNEKLNAELNRRKTQTKNSDDSKKILDNLIERELYDISKTHRIYQIKSKSPERVYNHPLKKYDLILDDKIFSAKNLNSKQNNQEQVYVKKYTDRPESAYKNDVKYYDKI